jgi:hypothetical protein
MAERNKDANQKHMGGSRPPFLLARKMPFFPILRAGLPARMASAGTMREITGFARRARRRAIFARSVLRYMSTENRAPTPPGGKSGSRYASEANITDGDRRAYGF